MRRVPCHEIEIRLGRLHRGLDDGDRLGWHARLELGSDLPEPCHHQGRFRPAGGPEGVPLAVLQDEA